MNIDTRSPGQVVESAASKIIGYMNLRMNDFFKFRHNCDAYMGIQKEPKCTFLTAFEHRRNKARSLFAAQY